MRASIFNHWKTINKCTLIYIPGSSRYVKFLPLGSFFGEKAHVLHTWKIQICPSSLACRAMQWFWWFLNPTLGSVWNHFILGSNQNLPSEKNSLLKKCLVSKNKTTRRLRYKALLNNISRWISDDQRVGRLFFHRRLTFIQPSHNRPTEDSTFTPPPLRCLAPQWNDFGSVGVGCFSFHHKQTSVNSKGPQRLYPWKQKPQKKILIFRMVFCFNKQKYDWIMIDLGCLSFFSIFSIFSLVGLLQGLSR